MWAAWKPYIHTDALERAMISHELISQHNLVFKPPPSVALHNLQCGPTVLQAGESREDFWK